MSRRRTLRAIEAANRRDQRESQKQLRELERRLKEEAKLSEMERARLEVETFDKQLEALLTIHQEQTDTYDWRAVATTLPPPSPSPTHFELKVHQLNAVCRPGREATAESEIALARAQDDAAAKESNQNYIEERDDWEKWKNLANRILAGDLSAYKDALATINPFKKISGIGSSLRFSFHDRNTLECRVKVKGQEAIPAEAKSLTTTGKLSVKSMPKGRFHEIYQDYICACVLRIGREIFAILPAENVIITAFVDSVSAQTGNLAEIPVLSVVISRDVLANLDFQRLDPSDSMENFVHRGDAKGSRKTGAFEPIAPLTISDLRPVILSKQKRIEDLITQSHHFRDEIKSEIEKMRQQFVLLSR